MLSHKSLIAWQESNKVVKQVLKISVTTWKPWLGAVFDQLQRSSLSVQLNIAEGYSFGESATFCRHLRIAYGSAVETEDLLDLLKDSEVCDAEELSPAVESCRATQRTLIGLMKRYGISLKCRKDIEVARRATN
jgi:four helix bundle protein